MTCPSLEHLAQYLAQELPPDRQERVRQHSATCETCRRELAGLARTAQVLAAMPAPAMPDHLWPGVALRLQARRAWWPVPAAAGLALSLLLGSLAVHRLQPERLPPASPMANSYMADHQFLAAQDPLADRASLGVALTSYTTEGSR